MSKKFYDVEFMATTYRTYEVEASSQEEAEEIAYTQLDEDWEVITHGREMQKLVM